MKSKKETTVITFLIIAKRLHTDVEMIFSCYSRFSKFDHAPTEKDLNLKMHKLNMKMNNFHGNEKKSKKKKRNNLFLKFTPWVALGAMALFPKPVKAQTEDNYQWRQLAWQITIDDSIGGYDILRWAFKKNGEPINDTTYMLNVAGTTYVCGTYTDTFYFSDTSDTYITSYTYKEGTISELTSLWEGVEMTDFGFYYWDSTATTWVEIVTIRGPPIKPITERTVEYFEQTPDSVKDNANTGVFDNDGVDKSYMVDHTIYYLSVTLSINDNENVPMTLNFKVYPNPTNAGFIVKLPDDILLDNGTLTIVDMNGRVIDKKIINGKEIKIDASDIASGRYIIMLNGESNDNLINISKEITIIK